MSTRIASSIPHTDPQSKPARRSVVGVGLLSVPSALAQFAFCPRTQSFLSSEGEEIIDLCAADTIHCFNSIARLRPIKLEAKVTYSCETMFSLWQAGDC